MEPLRPSREFQALLDSYTLNKHRRVAACFSDLPFWKQHRISDWFSLSRKTPATYQSILLRKERNTTGLQAA